MKKILVCILISLFLLSIAIPIIPVKASTPTVTLDPSTYNATQVNEVFTVTIGVSNVEGLWSWACKIKWDQEYVVLVDDSVKEGDFMTNQVGSTGFMSANSGTSTRDVQDVSLSTATASGSGNLAILQFKIIKQCKQTTISLFDLVLTGVGDASATTGAPKPKITPSSDSCTTIASLIIPGPPIANAGSAQTILQGTKATLNASKTMSTGENPTYTWTFMDGTEQTLSGEITDYTFDNAGVFDISLVVTDSLGSDNSTVTITVQKVSNAKITVDSFSQGQVIPRGQSITLRIADFNSSLVTNYLWVMSDSTSNTTTQEPSINHTFVVAGSYSINATINYSDGTTETARTTITVGDTQVNPTDSPPISPGANSTGNPTIKAMTQSSDAIPPTIIGILFTVTIIILVGSAFWLRKQT